MQVDDDWELSPEVASATVRQILSEEFFWDSADDDSPLGNDTGSDLLHWFRESLRENPTQNADDFFYELLDEWGVTDCDWVLPDGPDLARALETSDFSIITWDDAAIALAFAQLVLQARIEPSVGARALLAIDRESTPTVIAFRGWSDANERKQRLAQMRAAVGSAPRSNST